jgi:hypothetical protein
MTVRIWHVLPIMLWVSSVTRAQLLQPDSADQQKMLSQLKAYISTYKQFVPEISCVQKTLQSTDAVRGSLHSGGVVTIDLQSRQLQPRGGLGATIDVKGLIHELLAPDAQFSFSHLATLRGQQVGVFHYAPRDLTDTRSALIYADSNSGKISRIVFRGFDTTAHFEGLYCWTEN